LKKVEKQHYLNNISIVAKLSLWSIQVIITLAVFQFFRLVLFKGTVNWEASIVPFASTLVAAIAAFLLLFKYQNLVEEFSLIKARDAELTRINRELEAEVQLRKKTEESLRQSEELYRQLSITDPLTGIFNRRHFYQMANLELQRTCRYGHPLAVIMFDLDYFKRINDIYGHAVGDKVLQAVAHLVRKFVRVVDIFARYGGEEFILLLPETDRQAVSLTAERLRRQIASQPLNLEESLIKVTISLGAYAFDPTSLVHPPTPETLDLLINLADKALFEAKRTGRNRAVISDTSFKLCSSEST